MSIAVERSVRSPRSDVRVLVGTGAAVGAGCALLLPIVWMVAWGAFAGLDGAGIAGWVVISLVYAVPAAVVFALVGAVAGLVSALLWRQRHRWGRSRSQACAAAATATIVGISAGPATGLLLDDPLSGAIIGLVAASGASLAAASTLRRLARREAPSGR
ncbi:hypothetical protein ITJ55_00600 [Frigoribacterium sp. VKM Ac-1396]|uniref:hypothetical protein n=1 Tax=Frigoribacterium sp. VKM Ac-1396 TaxID=2783821 RepID=UPI00188B7B5C|nr:hypothetical protein [Frigoribacterium sp. VKM Ac-1396]MBF4599302.1 hypothetical protein [Frigoribacterium sp. VKM Ac-1396]